MLCYSCGKDIGNNLGLCPECNEMREQSHGEIRNKMASAKSIHRAQQVILLFAAGLFLAISAIFISAWAKKSERYELIKRGPNVLVMVGGDRARHSFITVEPFTFQGRIHELEVNDFNIVKTLGAQMRLIGLTDEDYKTYVGDVQGKQCPAGFLNGHMKLFFLLLPNEHVYQELKALRGVKDQKVSLKGAFLRRGDTIIDGFKLLQDPSTNGQLVLLSAISVDGRSIDFGVEG